MDASPAQLQPDPPAAEPRRVRVAHFLHRIRLEDGGVVRAVLDLCNDLAARCAIVTLVTTDPKDVPADWLAGAPDAPRVVTIDPSGLPAGWLASAALKRAESIIAGSDVLHLHGPWELGNLQLARRARRLGVPYIVTLHGMLDEWSVNQKWLKKRIFLRLAGRRFLARAARVQCAAEAERAQSGRFLRPGSAVVIPYVVDLSPYRDLPGPDLAIQAYPQLQLDGPRLLFISRLHPKKRPDLLIEAAARLAGAGKRPCQVIVAGPGDAGYVAQLKELARQRGLEQQIHFPGMVRGAMKLSLYQAADVFVLPTSQENFGYVLAEALACGTPAITTRGVDIWTELERAGVLIAEPDAEALAKAIASLLDVSAEERRRRGSQGRQWVLDQLAPQRVIGLYEQMYRAASDESAPRRAAPRRDQAPTTL